MRVARLLASEPARRSTASSDVEPVRHPTSKRLAGTHGGALVGGFALAGDAELDGSVGALALWQARTATAFTMGFLTHRD